MNSYGSEFNYQIDETAGVNEGSSIDSETIRYNDIPLLEDVIKVRKDLNHMTPSKKVFDVTALDTRASSDGHSNDQGDPTKLQFTDAYYKWGAIHYW